MDLPKLWAGANLGERRKLLLTVLDAVYVDTRNSRSIVQVKPKPAFQALLEVANVPLLANRPGPTIRLERVLRPSL